MSTRLGFIFGLLGEMMLFDGGFVVHYVVIIRRTADNLQHITLSGFL